ncbi:MAG TPA: diacylglycerol kinase family protein [Thermomicrobiaceae bacterium]|nr:diacylglycerol kinase family protein [Thermomicrobiaceae bacterium]
MGRTTEAGRRASSPAALIVNTQSRRGGRLYRHALALLREARVPLAITAAIDDPVRLPARVEQAVAAGCDRIMVGGGDGTISAVLASFVGRPVTLGILPLGTGNLAAHALGIAGLESAVQALVSDRSAWIDVGQAGDRYFLNSISIGLARAVDRSVTPSLKRALGSLAYGVAAVRAATWYRPFEVRLTIDGEVISTRAHDVVATNGRFIGPGLLAGPDASLDNGRLIVFTLGGGTRRQLLRQSLDIALGRPGADPELHYHAARRVGIVTDPPEVVAADGELIGHTPVLAEVHRGALRAFVGSEYLETCGRTNWRG